MKLLPSQIADLKANLSETFPILKSPSQETETGYFIYGHPSIVQRSLSFYTERPNGYDQSAQVAVARLLINGPDGYNA